MTAGQEYMRELSAAFVIRSSCGRRNSAQGAARIVLGPPHEACEAVRKGCDVSCCIAAA